MNNNMPNDEVALSSSTENETWRNDIIRTIFIFFIEWWNEQIDDESTVDINTTLSKNCCAEKMIKNSLYATEVTLVD